MSEVFEEFERDIALIHQKYADQPRKEMIELFLLALEREELVTVGYRESVMVNRLEHMPIDDEVRKIIHHALIWIWKDEDMHTIYIRGALLKLGNLSLRLQAFWRQAAGKVEGWSSSVLQHIHWRRAPISYALAKTTTAIGVMLGKVPEEVRDHLQYRPFRDFCLFNIDAEKTAWLCWARIVELTKDQTDFTPELVDDFRRVVSDEDRHAQVFTILANALDDENRLVEGVTVESLVEQLRAVSEDFLPRAYRHISDYDNPLGSGQTVWSRQGKTSEEKIPLFETLLDEADLTTHLKTRAQQLGKSLSEMHIAIKPTLMLGYHRKDLSPLTDPTLLERLATYLQTQGCDNISVVEGQNIYDHFYQNRRVHEVADYFEIDSPAFRLVDATEEQVLHRYSRGMAQYTISQTWRDADFRISFGKVRSHPIELAMLSVGNIEAIGERSDEFFFAERQADRTTAIMMLLDDFPPHFALLDGYDLAPDGLVGIMGCPKPQTPRRLYAGSDALAVDMTVARHLGIQHPRESSVLLAAYHWFGGWSETVKVVGVDEPIAGWRGPYHNDLWTLLSFLAEPVYTFTSGRGTLFVPEMDENAFPPLKSPGFLLRFGRKALQILLGLRHPRQNR
ncbi:MAG: DUF362 domain-containing protein [Chloroflexota bacterium]